MLAQDRRAPTKIYGPHKENLTMAMMKTMMLNGKEYMNIHGCYVPCESESLSDLNADKPSTCHLYHLMTYYPADVAQLQKENLLERYLKTVDRLYKNKLNRQIRMFVEGHHDLNKIDDPNRFMTKLNEIVHEITCQIENEFVYRPLNKGIVTSLHRKG